ncbi:hypothetical protein PIB30_051211, partial [Stylosanthes scabra]|nr:hypothetical protein [Stylosanthes scabra]
RTSAVSATAAERTSTAFSPFSSSPNRSFSIYLSLFRHGNHKRSFKGDSINHGDGGTVAGSS